MDNFKNNDNNNINNPNAGVIPLPYPNPRPILNPINNNNNNTNNNNTQNNYTAIKSQSVSTTIVQTPDSDSLSYEVLTKLVEYPKLQNILDLLVKKVSSFGTEVKKISVKMNNFCSPDELKKLVDKYKKKLKKRIEELVSEFQKQISAKDSKINNQNKDIANLSDSLIKLSEKYSLLEQKIDKMEAINKLEQLESRINICASKDQLKQIEEKFTILLDELKSLHITNMRSTQNSVMEEIQRIKSLLTSEVTRISKELYKHSSKDELAKQIDHMNLLSSTLNQSINDVQLQLSKDLKGLQDQINELNDLDKQKATVKALEDAIQQIRQYINSQLPDSFHDMKTNMNKLLSLCDDFKRNNDDFKPNLQSLRSEIATRALLTDFLELKSKIEQFQTKLGHDESYNELQSLLQKLDEKAQSLEKILQKKAESTVLSQLDQKLGRIDGELQQKATNELVNDKLASKVDLNDYKRLLDTLQNMKKDLGNVMDLSGDITRRLHQPPSISATVPIPTPEKHVVVPHYDMNTASINAQTYPVDLDLKETRYRQERPQSAIIQQKVDSIPQQKVLYKCLMCDRISPEMAGSRANEGRIAAHPLYKYGSPAAPQRVYGNQVIIPPRRITSNQNTFISRRDAFYPSIVDHTRGGTGIPRSGAPVIPAHTHPDYYNPDDKIYAQDI